MKDKIVWGIIIKNFIRQNGDWREYKFIDDTYGNREYKICTINELIEKYGKLEVIKRKARESKAYFIRRLCCCSLPSRTEREICTDDYLQYFEIYSVWELKGVG